MNFQDFFLNYGLLILLGKVMIMVGCGVLTYIWVEGSGSFTYEETVANADEGVTLIKSPVVSVIFTKTVPLFFF